MFQNSYQNGSYFDFFDPKANQDKLKLLYKTTNIQPNHKIFDKQLKTYVLESVQTNSKMSFPKQDKKDLYLIQQYLVFHIYFYQGMSWNMELTVSDLTKTKRRVILSPATTKTELKPFFVKTPVKWQQGLWNTLTVDLYSYMDAFKGQTYRSLDSILISGHFKLRRIYTTSAEPQQCSSNEQLFEQIKPVINFLPKQFYLPMGVPAANVLNRYDISQVSQTISEVEHSTKNSSFLKSSKTKHNIPAANHKTRVEGEKVSRDGNRLKIQQYKTEVSVKQVKTQKNIRGESRDRIKVQQKKKKDFLSNTNDNIMAAKKKQKQRLSVDKNSLSQKMQRGSKSNPKGKTNPWRTNKDQGLSDASNLAISKHESYRKAITPQNCTAFKKSKLESGSEFNQTKNRAFEGYSDSQYVELSQKFSTFTDGKFLKTGENVLQPYHLQIPKQNHQEEIQENIELESNSMYSTKRQRQEQIQQIRKNNGVEFIKESINDSLDVFEKKGEKIDNKIQEMGRSSLYGFGQNLMKNFMARNIERPYSPPIGQRQSTQSQSQHKSPHSKPQFQKDEVQLIFDPVLNCYYDYKTHTYYQLKN